jgi:hypothetical protein
MSEARALHLARWSSVLSCHRALGSGGTTTTNRISVKTLIKCLVAVFIAGLTSLVHAQLLEDVSLRRDGTNAVVQVRFVLQVRLKRVIATGSDDLAQVQYDVVDLAGLKSLNAATGQRRVLSGGDGIPRLTVTDDELIGNATTRKLGVRFDRPVRFAIRTGPGDRTIEIVLEGLGDQVASPTTPVAQAPQAPDADKRYLITLVSSRDPNVQMEMPVPGALQEYQVFTDRRSVGGQPLYEINLGYFTTLPEAEQARTLLLRRFPKAVVVSLSDRSAAPAPAVAAAATPAPAAASAPPRTVQGAPAASAQLQTKASQLMAAAKSALDAKDIDGSIQALNQLLDLPANSFSREAQELVGFVRLRAGDTVRARTEFELFLKLYPNGPDSDRVRQKLAGLPKPSKDPQQPGGERRQAAATPPSTTVNGSLSARYFELRDKVDDPLLNNGQAPSRVLAARSLDIAADLSIRYRDADRDARFVFNDSNSADLLNERNRNRLNSLYLDYRSFSWGTNVRLGRQAPIGGGVFGRFDGIQAGYAFLPKWRLNAVGGVQVDQPFASKSNFFGLSVDAEALSPNLSGSIYAVTDITDKLTDRRAFGAELRYFNGGVSASTAVDYDQFINALNFLSMQASWQLPSNTTFNFLYEVRAQNGFVAANQGLTIGRVNADPLNKLEDLVKLVGEDAVRKVVKDTTGYPTQFLLGATTPVSKNWQIGADVRLTNVGAIDAIDPAIVGGPFEFGGFQGSGNVYSLSTQLVGSNIYSRRDTHVFNVSLLRGELFKAVSLSYNNSSAIGESFLLEPSLRFFFQDSLDPITLDRTKTTSVSPGLRLSYQVTQRIALDADLNYEYRREVSADNDVTTNSVFYILGGRVDF